jgi:Zn-dependent alcohol dehydrogenase
MKTRAAVAFEAKPPPEIIELDLDGPKAGEAIFFASWRAGALQS